MSHQPRVPYRALDLAAELSEWLDKPWSKEMLHRQAMLIGSVALGPGDALEFGMRGDEYVKERMRGVADRSYEDMRAMLRFGEVVYVEDDMTELVAAGANEMPDLVTIEETDLLVPSGLAVFERPIEITDVREVVVKIRAIGWHKRPPGFSLVYFAHSDDDDSWDPKFTAIRREMANQGYKIPTLSVIHYEGVGMFGEEQNLRHARNPNTLEMEEITEPWPAVPYALWYLMAQFVKRTYFERAPRAVRKRAERAKLPEHEIRVVTLRRLRGERKEPTEGGGIDWQHRWIVHGFWRMQPYPSLGIRRRIWIADFVKGPEDKPLLVKPRVFRFSR